MTVEMNITAKVISDRIIRDAQDISPYSHAPTLPSIKRNPSIPIIAIIASRIVLPPQIICPCSLYALPALHRYVDRYRIQADNKNTVVADRYGVYASFTAQTVHLTTPAQNQPPC